MDMSVWFLMGAALVFFMQCGFAMVEAGFTRSKNTGNITMKNLMDFCIGTVAFYLLGYNILCGDGKFVGWGLNPLKNFGTTDWSNFVFNLVFCATAATIVSGAMAERTKFITYCIYSFVISLIVYPVEAHWVWGGTPWLTDLGFTDFAGSACIHMVGGITAFIGAALLGPRIGKYDKDGKSRPIMGHNILIGALGVFILWFGWYGFNGAAATDTLQLSQIFATTTIAPAAATVTAMIYTWIKNGKPDVSMSLNGSLAGLVAITAGCANVDAVGACVGINGARVNAVVDELQDEKMDIINWSDNPAILIENALSPSKVVSVLADPENKEALVVVPDSQLSLAIGKEGQNARLAARLTGFKIDIKSESQAKEEGIQYVFKDEDYYDDEYYDGEYYDDEYYDGEYYDDEYDAEYDNEKEEESDNEEA